MAFVNYNNKEITIKIVYYGPALSGKTTCLRYIYSSKQVRNKGKLITLDTDGDRTLFFDFLPIEIGKLGDYSLKIQLYTVPGQVSYDTTRKLVLQGADGVVFVADSQVTIREQNNDSWKNLEINLQKNNIAVSEIPIILQYNKRDLKEILPVDELNKDLNSENRTFFPTVATTGENILESLHTIMKMVIISLKNKLSIFQKDKTVMFSKEEITASSPAEEEDLDEYRTMPMQRKLNEDTEKEEIFELSKPFIDEEEEAAEEEVDVSGQEEDIFDLDDGSLLGKVDEDIEVPDVSLGDELGDEKEAAETESGPIIELTDEDKISGVSAAERVHQIDLEAGEQTATIHLVIPKDKDEVKVNLNLQLHFKRK
jgi:small GTP-binding protein